MTSRVLSPSRSAELVIGRDLVLSIFQVWRRDLDCADALILLVIATANVEGVLFSRELRKRYGGERPIAPDSLRQPISSHAVAVSLGMSDGRVRQRVAALAECGECEIGPEGMIITEHQLEATNRTAVVRAVYVLLAGAYARLRTLDALDLAGAPRGIAAEPPVRSASAFGAKYVLRTLESIAAAAGGMIGALVLLELLRRTAPDPIDTLQGGGLDGGDSKAVAVAAAELAATLGLSPRRAQAEVRALLARGLCERRGRGLATSWDAFPRPLLAALAERNCENLFQLLAALGDIGALARFENGDADRLGR